MKVLGYFCEAEKKGSRSSLIGKTNKSCHTLHTCSNIQLVTSLVPRLDESESGEPSSLFCAKAGMLARVLVCNYARVFL